MGIRHLKIISYRCTTSLVIRLGYLIPICVLCKACWIYDLIHSYSHICDRWDFGVDLPYRMSSRSPMGACRSPLKRHLPGSCPLCALYDGVCKSSRTELMIKCSVMSLFSYVVVVVFLLPLLSKSSSEWMHGMRRLCCCWKQLGLFPIVVDVL